MNKGKTILMGYGERDITPDRPVPLVGFLRPTNQSRGVLDRLTIQTLLFHSEEESICIVTIDSIGFTVDLSTRLREQIARQIDTTKDQVMICFSHSHSAPDAATTPGYFEFVCRRASESLEEALSTLEPAYASWSIGESHIGINRRGKSHHIDRRIGILRFVDSSEDMKMIVLRVTAHANVLTSDNYLISSDYFGTTRKLVEDHYGCKVMIIQGASGDIKPAYQQENGEYLEIHSYEAALKGYSNYERELYFAQSQEALSNMAKDILNSVDKEIKNATPQPIRSIGAFSTICHLSSNVPSMKEARHIAEEARTKAGIDGTEWLEEVEALIEDNIENQFSDVEIQYFFLNEGCICGIPNEAMCKIALDIEKNSKDHYLFFNGYTNGCSSYLPTAEEYDKGGYEVLWSNLVYFRCHGRVMPLNRDSADKIIEKVVDSVKSYRGTKK